MSEEKEKKYPEPVVAAIIYNDKSEILLIQSPKWGEGKLWMIPGGHIEIGETAKEALRREIKEETGLIINNIDFLICGDGIYPEYFYKKKHFIFQDFCAKATGGEIIKSDEVINFIWVDPLKALKTLKIEPYTVRAIQVYINQKKIKEEDYKDKYLRALADYQNLLKQVARDKEEFARYTNEQFILEILPVYDNLKMSLTHIDEAGVKNGWAEGIKHVIGQFSKVLRDAGVEEIKTTREKFDHNMMEAVESEETDDKKKDGMVAREMSAGYKLNGKIIKAARVVVYKIL